MSTPRTKPHNNTYTPSGIANPRFLDTLAGKPVDRPPVWLMRQAGRYLEEYRAVRKKFENFMDLCQTPEATTELAMQPLKRFDLDAAILFSDILTIPHALDMGVRFVEKLGPCIHTPIKHSRDVFSLPFDEVIEKCDYVYQAIRHLKATLNQQIPLIGFAGSPWTLACYMLEGKSTAQFPKAKQFMYEHPIAMEELINQLSTVIAGYLAKQAEAGADVLFLIDTWGALLPQDDFQLYSLNALMTIQKELKSYYHIDKPFLLYSKGLRLHHQSFFSEHGFQGGLGLDWTFDLASAQNRFSYPIQGNLDPHILLAGPTITQNYTQRMLESLPSAHQGFVASLGHGILPSTPVESVHAFVDTVKAFTKMP